MNERAALIELLLSYLEGKITLDKLKESLKEMKPTFEINALINQINSTNDNEKIKEYVTDCLEDITK